ncbi:MAG TPA: TPM domain-containing protein [Opitutaceae bacterium]|nr:TPM domain-containing protein [Opitutaceae bacterium]
MRWPLILPLLGALLLGAVHGAEVIPPAPLKYFNDYAGIVRADAARQLDAELTQFERTTSNQIVVAIFPYMQSDSSIEDYTVRVAQSWRVGQRDKKNGAVLFIFSQDRKLYIQVGYGLEGVLPDARCKQIIANEITPRFRTGDYTAGVTAGVHALMAATRGEYHGTGRIVAEKSPSIISSLFPGIIFWLFFGALAIHSVWRARRGFVYGGSGSSTWIDFGGGGGSGGFFSGGGGGGSFSGGGGSFGGGGAGGSW